MNFRSGLGCTIAAAAFVAAAQAQVTTTVSLTSQDAEAAKYALPSIEVRVDGPDAGRSHGLAAALSHDLVARTHARAPEGTEAATYVLAASLPARDGTLQRFDARLIALDGEVVWSVEGTTNGDVAPRDEVALLDIARNLRSALVRDGWVEAKYDPNDPPPPPPALGGRGR
jgi:hypothetical protein